MRDAAGQLADGLHALSLTQRVLRLALVGDVGEGRHYETATHRIVADGAGADFHPAELAAAA